MRVSVFTQAGWDGAAIPFNSMAQTFIECLLTNACKVHSVRHTENSQYMPVWLFLFPGTVLVDPRLQRWTRNDQCFCLKPVNDFLSITSTRSSSPSDGTQGCHYFDPYLSLDLSHQLQPPLPNVIANLAWRLRSLRLCQWLVWSVECLLSISSILHYFLSKCSSDVCFFSKVLLFFFCAAF